MKIQISIIGLGQIGTSVGLALTDHKDQIFRVGHDASRDAAKKAKELGGIDKIFNSVSGSVKNADIILLSVPFHEIYPVMQEVVQYLKEDGLVMDTAPLKQPVMNWAEELIPENSYYIGLTPVLSYAYAEELAFGQETARPDLFKDCLMGVVCSRRANEKAVSAAANFVQLLGASPFFTDAAENDGLMTLTHIIPRLIAASLLKISHEAPGWREARKVAGKAYTQVTNPFIQDDIPPALAAAVIYNKENTTRIINDLIRTLVQLRDLTDTPGQQDLEDLFNQLQSNRDIWRFERQKKYWEDISGVEMPKESALSRLLGFRRPESPQVERKK